MAGKNFLEDNLLAPIVGGLTETLLCQETPESNASDLKDIYKETSLLMVETLKRMPRFLGIPIMILTIFFDGQSFFTSGKRFSRQALHKRQEQIRQWQRSFLSVCRDFVQLYQKMVVFIYYSQKEKRHEQL